jgi:alpha-tubulin suppressor-like RCC1 family protein
LGDGSTKRSLVPVAVDQRGVLSGKTVIAVIAGGYGNKGFKSYSLALCSDGTLAAWGANDSGQMGNGTLKSSLVPVAVNQSGALSGRTVVSIAAGGYRNLVLCSDGTMAVWGSAGGGGFSSPVPVAIKPIGALAGKTVIAVAVGFDHCLALCSDGTVVAWGGTFWQGNVYPGVLGNNTSAGSLVPVAVNTQGVLSGRKVVAVAAGASHSLALCSDGTLVAWGDNFHGQLGNNGGRPLAAPGKQKVRKTVKGTPANAYIPVLVDQTGVLAGKTIIAMTAARHHSLVLCSDGTMAAWGGNYGGSLGDNTTESSLVPIAVSKAALANGERFVGISTGTSLVYSYNLAIVASSSDSN